MSELLDDIFHDLPEKKRKVQTAGIKYEELFYEQGYQYIFGFDEVGRGPMAGPLVAGAVCLPISDIKRLKELKGVRDSKQMTEQQREKLSPIIQEVALTWGIGQVDAVELNEMKLTKGTYLAFERALQDAQNRADIKPDCLFLDYVAWAEKAPLAQFCLPKGDAHSLTIACASVIAKVYRDNLMVEMSADYPEYGFDDHKGYITAKHKQALSQYGVTPIHRTFYDPVQEAMQNNR